MKNNYFDYIVYLALKIKVIYDDKLFINTKQFHDFRLNILNNINKYCSIEEIDDEGFDIKLDQFIEYNKAINEESEKDLLNKFVSNNSNVSFENDTISLKKEEPLKELIKIKIKVENYTDYYDEILLNVLNHSIEDISNLELLSATSKIKDIKKLLELETKIEELYETNQYSDPNISYYKLIIYEKLKDIYENSSVTNISSYLNIINSYLEENKENDIYLKAIFSKDKLSIYKLNNYFMALEYMKQDDMLYKYDLNTLSVGVPKNNISSYEETNDFILEVDHSINDSSIVDDIENDYNINYSFYSKYIELIDNYQNNYGKNHNLELIKNRLLYLIDRDPFEIEKHNYKDKDYLKYNKITNDIIKKHSTILDIKQILFLITYYDLTKSPQIKKFLKEKHIDYNKYIQKQKTKDSEQFSDKIKKLIKTRKN